MKHGNTLQIASLLFVGILAFLLGLGYKTVLRHSNNGTQINRNADIKSSVVQENDASAINDTIAIGDGALDEESMISIVIQENSSSLDDAAKPLLFCHASLPFTLNLTPGSGRIAKLNGLKDIQPTWVKDYYTTLALKRYTKCQRYIAVGNLDGLRYLNEHAALFDGAVVALTSGISGNDMQDWSNLANLPLAFIFPSNTRVYPSKLPKALGSNSKQPRKVLRYAANPPDDSTQLAAAFNWLCENAPTAHREIIWCGTTPPEESQFWLTVDALEKYNSAASIRASVVDDGKIKITCSNIKQFTIIGTALPNIAAQQLAVEINGNEIGTYAKTAQLSFHEQDGYGWEVGDAPATSKLAKHAGTCGPILQTLHAPCIAIYGTMLADTAAAWKQSADQFIQTWERINGVRIKVIADRKCTQEILTGHNLLLFGSPEENSISAMLLRENPGFLRQIFASLPEPLKNLNELCALTVIPADEITSSQSALILLTDYREAIPQAWRALIHPNTANYDFFFYLTKQNKSVICGNYDSVWRR